jgi:hypothetical protein
MPTKRDSGGEFAGGGFRGIGPALAGNVGAGRAFALCARGIRMWTFLCSLRPGPAAAGCGQLSNGDSGSEFAGEGFRGIGPALAGNVGAGRVFALCARGIRMWTFQRSLRSGPAAAGCGQLSNGDSGSEFAGGGLSRDRSCARRERGGRSGFRAVREGYQDEDVPMLASARSRGCWVRPAVERGLG